MAKPLTDAAIRRFKPAAQRRRIKDAGARSLYLVIEPSGHRSFEMRFRRPDGRPAKIRIGTYDMSGHELQGDPQVGQPLTLAAARALAAAIHRQRAQGQDVIADHKAARHRQRAAVTERAAGTFGVAASDFIEHARPSLRSAAEYARVLGLCADGETIRGGLAERWADRDVRSIDGHDIWSVTEEARERGIPGLEAHNSGRSDARARLLFLVLSSMFTWLMKRRRIDVNPCKAVARPTPPPARERVLTADEIKRLWGTCDQVGEPYGTIIKLLLLTGGRLNEVAGMRRSELHPDGTWQLPGARTKNKKPHVVPLPPLARELIAAVPGDSDVVFKSQTGSTPVSAWSRVKRRLDAAMGNPAAWRLHDLRRTAVTVMIELGVAPHVVELVVNHISGAKAGVAGVYNRSQMLPERKAALERWAAHLEGLVSVNAANVVPLRRRT